MTRTMPQDGVLTIRPSDIDCSGHFWNAFDHSETEISANYIVRLCQRKAEWAPFSLDEIEAFYREHGHRDGFTFNRLVDPGVVYHREQRSMEGGGWIILGSDGLYRVTADFVMRCHLSAPAAKE